MAAASHSAWLARQCEICEKPMGEEPREDGYHVVCVLNAQKLVNIGFEKGRKAGALEEQRRTVEENATRFVRRLNASAATRKAVMDRVLR